MRNKWLGSGGRTRGEPRRHYQSMTSGAPFATRLSDTGAIFYASRSSTALCPRLNVGLFSGTTWLLSGRSSVGWCEGGARRAFTFVTVPSRGIQRILAPYFDTDTPSQISLKDRVIAQVLFGPMYEALMTIEGLNYVRI